MFKIVNVLQTRGSLSQIRVRLLSAAGWEYLFGYSIEPNYYC